MNLTMLDHLGTNPTQLVGILSFAAASIACFVAARQPQSKDASTWKALTVINSLFLVEILTGIRHRLHNFAVTTFFREGKYAQRGPIQEIVILSLVVIAIILAVILFFSWRKTAGGPAKIVMSITFLVLLLFAIETVSLHAVDAVFYQTIGSVMMIGWFWLFAGCGVVFATSLRKRHNS
jgi:hypothetical protein